MAISKRKLKSNQQNAKKSTGPRTKEGKEKVSANRTKHGLCGRFSVLPNENQEEYDALLLSFMDSEKPANDVERELVAKMARHTWLSQRAACFQEACFVPQPRTPDQIERETQSVGLLQAIELYIRYQKHNDRAYQQAAAELAKRRKERDLTARGFESQKRAEAEETRRETRHNQRTELHQHAAAHAQLRLDRQKQLMTNQKPAPRSLKTNQIAA